VRVGVVCQKTKKHGDGMRKYRKLYGVRKSNLRYGRRAEGEKFG